MKFEQLRGWSGFDQLALHVIIINRLIIYLSNGVDFFFFNKGGVVELELVWTDNTDSYEKKNIQGDIWELIYVLEKMEY